MKYQTVTFDCEEAVRDKGVKVYVVTLGGLQNQETNLEFEAYQAEVCRKILVEWSEKSLPEDPVLRGFRDLHTQFGFSNRTFPAASESLLEYLFKHHRLPHINLVRMDWNDLTKDVLAEIYGRKYQLDLAGYETNRAADSCPFIEQGSTAIRWDGSVCPCLPLLHTNQNYFENRLRHSQAYTIGNVLERNLLDIWNDEEYSNLRERVQRFDFSPCTFCNGCGLSENNQEDCLGNTKLACGGCLWAQGVIRCP